MKVLAIIFYYYYSFFKKRMPFDVSPEFSTIIGIGAVLCFAIMGIIGVPLAFAGRFALLITMFIIGVCILIVLYKYFILSNKWKEIIKNKPIIKNNRVSIAIVIAFFVFGILCAICGPIIAKQICNGIFNK